MPKVNWTSAGNDDKCGCCEPCSGVIFQSLTAHLPHHGFSPFATEGLCGGSGEAPEGTRYLTLTFSGLGTQGAYCGGSKKHGRQTKKHVVDPLTGYICNTSAPGINFWCSQAYGGAGNNTQCSPTSLKWDCGTVAAASICEEGEDIPLTLEETLSDAYTIAEVASNVTNLLGQHTISDSNIPPGAGGSVVVGSGHSAINWGGSSATCAYYYKGYGHVMKTKLRVTFKTAGIVYKLITTDENGTVTNEEEATSTENQVLNVDPPSEPGSVCVTPACSFGGPASVDCSISGNYTTRRLVCRDPDTDEQIPCGGGCSGFLAPDCKPYNTLTTTFSGSYQESYDGTWNWCTDEPGTWGHTWDWTSNSSGTTTETACPTYSVTNEGNGSQNVDYTDKEYEKEAFNASNTIDFATGEETCDYSDGYGDTLDDCRLWMNFHGIAGGGQCMDCDGSYTDTTNESECHYTANGTQTRTYSKTIDNTSVTCTSSETSSSNTNFICVDEESCPASGDLTSTHTRSFNGQGTTTHTWENKQGAEGTGDGQWESETTPHESGCVERYSQPTYSTESTATYTCTLKFTAPEVPEGEPAKYYSVWYNYYDLTEEPANDGTGASKCPVRTVTADSVELGTSSSGGEVSISISVPQLSADEGTTKCRVGFSAWVYEII